MTTSTEPHDSAADHAAGSLASPGLAPMTSPRACRHVARRVAGQRGAAHAAASEPRTAEVPEGRALDTGAFDIEPRAGALDAPTICGENGPRYRRNDPPRSAHVGDPGELIAALPALVGFAPQRSLVVAVLRAGVTHGERPVIEALARFDLAPETRQRARVSMFTACIAQICAVEQAAEVLVIVVDDRLSGPSVADADADADADALVASLDKRLGRRGIEVGGGWAVRGIEAGARWWSLFDREQRGEVPDPTASPVTLAHVLEGRPIRRSRAELTALVEADTVRQGEVAVLLPAALAMARDRFTRAVTHGDLDGYRRNALEFVLWQIAHVESGAVPTVPEIAELVAALRDRAVRDTMFALAVGDHAAAAESLWLALVRALSGPDRAEVAALLGYSAYIRGDGPFAGIALDAALLADPFHPMAILLETSLRAGMRPEALRRLARSGYDTAACLGIELGPAVR